VAPRSQGAISGLEFLDGILAWLLRVAAAAIILITGYYVYATWFQSDQLFRGMATTGGQIAPAEFQRFVANMQLLMKLLTLAAVVVIVAGLIRFYDAAEFGGVLVVVGLLLAAGMPLLIDGLGGETKGLSRRLAALGNPREYLRSQYVFAGAMLLVVGAIQLLVHGVLYALSAAKRRPKADPEAAKTAAQVRKTQDRFLGFCWELPFCRDTDKKLCPIRNTKKPCWRTGRGCYCDQNVILTISGGSAYAQSRGAMGHSSRATVVRPKSLSEKREQCLQCPVYLHHQSQKYKLLAPLTVIATIACFVLFRDSLRQLYPGVITAFGRAMAGLSFGPKPDGVPVWAGELAANATLSWMLLIVLGILIVAYLLHAVEWTLYRLGV
jgi:hypothetical protein